MARSERTEPLPLKPTTIALIRQKAGAGIAAPQIAREIGWTQQRLARVCAAHGIEITTSPTITG